MFKTAFASAALSLVLVAAPAAAGSSDNQEFTIEYRDLNLASPEGQETLDRRINAAARKVCGVGAERTGTRLVARKSKECVEQVRASAQEQIATLVEDERLGG